MEPTRTMLTADWLHRNGKTMLPKAAARPRIMNPRRFSLGSGFEGVARCVQARGRATLDRTFAARVCKMGRNGSQMFLLPLLLSKERL